jgi:phenylalanyl-tRNA synthetase beta subunit
MELTPVEEQQLKKTLMQRMEHAYSFLVEQAGETGAVLLTGEVIKELIGKVDSLEELAGIITRLLRQAEANEDSQLVMLYLASMWSLLNRLSDIEKEFNIIKEVARGGGENE